MLLKTLVEERICRKALVERFSSPRPRLCKLVGRRHPCYFGSEIAVIESGSVVAKPRHGGKFDTVIIDCHLCESVGSRDDFFGSGDFYFYRFIPSAGIM